MIYVHSLGRASRYYAQRGALVVDGAVDTFKALHERVQNIAAALAILKDQYRTKVATSGAKAL